MCNHYTILARLLLMVEITMSKNEPATCHFFSDGQSIKHPEEGVATNSY